MNDKLVTVYKEPAVASFKHYAKLYVRTLEDHEIYQGHRSSGRAMNSRAPRECKAGWKIYIYTHTEWHVFTMTVHIPELLTKSMEHSPS